MGVHFDNRHDFSEISVLQEMAHEEESRLELLVLPLK